ncbi:hypothetical protein ACJDU8_04620 [Clostridium sp. WILCCON 0269]|uniref:RDD domain-containing protein n=1 Tax=Candidatus Clostridium eludens TaxID=3381663 RepID=A0ABW8SI58_9CLOT
MTEKNDNQEQLSVDEQAKQQFLEELKNKNMEEKRKLEEFKNQQEKNKSGDEVENIDEDEIVNAEKEENESGNELEDINTDDTAEFEEEESNLVDTVGDIDESKENEFRDELENNIEVMNKNEIVNVNKEKNSKDKTNKMKISFLPKKLKASIIDTVITSLVSLGILYLFDAILRVIGYQVVDMKGMFIIVFIIILILYPFIMSKCKYKKTIGEKFSEILK